jgi:RNA polymerase sigma factor (sigma-70 family)
MRAALTRFFECRGCYSPHELTDETINRVACKIVEGEEIPASSLSAYFYGVARNILREHLRAPDRKLATLDGLLPSEQPSQDHVELDPFRLDRIRSEQRLECLDECVGKLPPETQKLIMSYYEGDEGQKIENRKRVAETFGLSLSALRIRTYRIREKLYDCILNCIKALKDDET